MGLWPSPSRVSWLYWDEVSSNVERLPHLAYILEKHTPKLRSRPAADAGLFTFAKRPDWKERLNRPTLDAVAALLEDYEKCLTRIRGLAQGDDALDGVAGGTNEMEALLSVISAGVVCAFVAVASAARSGSKSDDGRLLCRDVDFNSDGKSYGPEVGRLR